jgi:hypothetical protein
VLFQLALAICLLLQLGEAAHFVLVRHAICAEHGDAIHVARTPGPGAHARSVGRERDRGLAVSSDERAPGDSHEHCPFTPHRARRALVAQAESERSMDAQLTAAAPPHSTPACSSPSALRLIAPKTSPPATT